MKEILIFGGSFNPLHNGHFAMIEAARVQLSPDEIWLMPAKQPPHKPSYGGISDEDRIGMLTEFAKGHKDICVRRDELDMEGFTYTANTLTMLNEKYPDYCFTFLIGGDSISSFHKWYKPDVIVSLANIAICTREDCDKEEIADIIFNLERTIGGRYTLLDFMNVDVSSTQVREVASKNGDISSLVPAEIASYIQKHGLYLETTKEYNASELYGLIKNVLPEKRFKHVEGVIYTAKKLAEIYGVSVDKAEIAALLHDCAKCMSAEALVNLCKQNNVHITGEEMEDELSVLSLLHSKAGSILAKNIYYIEDESILSAVYYHTVGRPDMTMLEKIVFVADYIEPGRTQKTEPSLDEIRKISFEDIDNAVYIITRNTVNFLQETGRNVCSDSIKTLEYYEKLIKERE